MSSWVCPLCQRQAEGRTCPNGHDLPSPARELLELATWVVGACEDSAVVRVVEGKLAELGLEPTLREGSPGSGRFA